MDIKATFAYTHSLTLLFVEDDLSIQKETAEMLKKFFKEVKVAGDGMEGIDLYHSFKKESGEYFDLVITDINMPKMSGIEMIEEIKKENEAQPIIVVSAHNETSYLIPLLQLGVDNFLLKPIDISNLTDTLFKSCRAIHDHKLAVTYNKHIEELNLTLTEKNAALETTLRQLESLIYAKQVKEKQKQKKDTSKENQAEIITIDQEVCDLLVDDLPELIDMYEDLDTIFANLSIEVRNYGKYDQDSFNLAIEKLRRYSFKLSTYSSFKELSENVEQLAGAMKDGSFPEDKESLESVFTLIESFMFMIHRWHNEWQNGEIEKINFFYKSVISDIKTIINVLQEPEESAQEIEFF